MTDDERRAVMKLVESDAKARESNFRNADAEYWQNYWLGGRDAAESILAKLRELLGGES